MISSRSVLLTIMLAFASTSCTGELSERIEELTLATNSLQEQVEELKVESAASAETLEAIRKQIEHPTETSVSVSGLYELSDVEAIGFKAEKDKTVLNQLSTGFLGSLFPVEYMSEGLLEVWEGSFPVAGESLKVGIYLYDKNIEGKFGMMQGLAPLLGEPHIAVGNIIVSCDSKKVCDLVVDALKSN